jgi:hypothetical protein
MLIDLFEIAGRMPANLLRFFAIVFVPTLFTCVLMRLDALGQRRAL